ncbi:MAG: protein BatD, partial [Gammaproteobacteria bacterium]|nr:protein BatD [Gammaproteobacteria bacterium]
IEFGKDISPGLNIKIHKSSATNSAADKNLFLETELDQQTAYVQAQLIYTVRLYRSIDIQNASLTEPELSDADAIVEKLGEDKRYQTTRNGVRFIVIERRYAIFPQQSGNLSIQPVQFNGQIVSQRRSFFDITPFNNITKRIQSKQIDITVKPVPNIFKNKNWLPSSELKLVDEWPENTVFKVGEPVTRTISLLATGLTAAQLPVISNQEIENIKQYPDQPTLNNQTDKNGIIGIRQEKIAFIPTLAGKITLPEINIPWWNTRSGKLEYARIETKTIDVKGSTQLTQTPVFTDNLSSASGTENTADVLITAESSSFWFYASLFMLTGWLITLYFLFQKRKNKTAESRHAETNETPPSITNISKKFASACNQNNRELCKSLLIQWASQQWPDDNISSLGDVAVNVNETLRLQINILNQSLYSKTPVDWDSKQLLSAFETLKGKPLNKFNNVASPLKNINKIVN